MIAYLDASVVPRLVLGEPGEVAQWPAVERAVASALTEVECLRTLDRMERRGVLAVGEVAFATHGRELAMAASAMGFEVFGA